MRRRRRRRRSYDVEVVTLYESENLFATLENLR
jgi:hypothetical protein